ncbi:Metal-dependent membrane protease, CAAX family [Halanaeroarchaeum sp. HSR-CO]|uniref:hypothetical protein n=1 Tax=Halanaeroarchaeum sp. HSR-CO TaxID=2866382 RepID=UPI00217F0295|nr:hypothetical protein [Halanaeroarchaeum sp. HSR-CO]UWG49092.1 Metal-dependent membrane protease, CAAX family [Halanaeroarchaeum sp. HSR-CO]
MQPSSALQSRLSGYGAMLALAALGVMGLAATILAQLTFVSGVRTGLLRQALLSQLAAPAVIVVVGALAGAAVADHTGFHSIVHEWGRSGAFEVPDGRAWVLGGGAGLVVGFVVLAENLASGVPLGTGARSPLAYALAAIGRLVYLGVGQELVLRWGLVSLVASFGFGWFDVANSDSSGRTVAIGSIAVVAIGAALLMAPAPGAVGAATAARVFVVNAVPGLVFGWLFWAYALEVAMVGHVMAHLPIVLASLLR